MYFGRLPVAVGDEPTREEKWCRFADAQLISMRDEMMEMLALPTRLREKVKDFYDYVWIRHSDFASHQLINALPAPLKRDVSTHVYMAMIKKVPAFENCDGEFLARLCIALRPEVFL